MRLKHPSIREDPPATLVWALFVAVLILAGSVIAGGLYLNARRAQADTRAAQQRHGICAILDTIPAGHYPAIDTARRDFDCGPPKPPLLTPRVTVTVGPRTKVVRVTPAPDVIIPPGPTVTITPAPRPTVTTTTTVHPSKQPTHPATPSPTPTRSRLCLLMKICLP